MELTQEWQVHHDRDMTGVPMRVREFTDRTGNHWVVRAMRTDRVPGAKRSECLVFDGQSVVRRIWDYPQNWDELPTSALAELGTDP